MVPSAIRLSSVPVLAVMIMGVAIVRIRRTRQVTVRPVLTVRRGGVNNGIWRQGIDAEVAAREQQHQIHPKS